MTEVDAALIAKAEALAHEWAPGCRLTQSRRLQGGISAQMFALNLILADGGKVSVVARFPSPELARYFNDPVQQEFLTLARVSEAGIPAPRPLAVNGELLLMEHLSGTATAAPDDPDGFVDQMAEVIAAIHETDLSSGRFDFLMETRFTFKPPEREPNLDLREPEVIAAAIACAPREPWTPVLRHGDFWPGNLLWTEGRLTGVVDWENALLGPALADLAISRLDIWWVFGREAMQRFTAKYLELRPLQPRDEIVVMPLNLRVTIEPKREALTLWNGGTFLKEYRISKSISVPLTPTTMKIENKGGIFGEKKVAPGMKDYRASRKTITLGRGLQIVPTEEGGEAAVHGCHLDPADTEELALLLRVGNEVEIRP